LLNRSIVVLSFPHFIGHQDKSYNQKIGGLEDTEEKRRSYNEGFKKDAVADSMTSKKWLKKLSEIWG